MKAKSRQRRRVKLTYRADEKPENKSTSMKINSITSKSKGPDLVGGITGTLARQWQNVHRGFLGE